MNDIRKLKELVRLMVSNDLTEVDLRDSEEQVTIRRPSPLQTPVVSHHGMGPGVHAHTPVLQGAPFAVSHASAATTAPTVETDDGLIAIESPMVGTFYATPDPDSPPFISSGSPVSPGTVVCLIEAMKIFNEIKAEVSGTVERVLVANGDAVEFGQDLFLVRPD
jgi:acetyl-CoA carboxylase biotin carboxyl carrier protein